MSAKKSRRNLRVIEDAEEEARNDERRDSLQDDACPAMHARIDLSMIAFQLFSSYSLYARPSGNVARELAGELEEGSGIGRNRSLRSAAPSHELRVLSSGTKVTPSAA
jgi:hypothetical protein